MTGWRRCWTLRFLPSRGLISTLSSTVSLILRGSLAQPPLVCLVGVYYPPLPSNSTMIYTATSTIYIKVAGKETILGVHVVHVD